MDKVSDYTILIVDDARENLMVLTEILKPFYRVKAANNGEIALKIAGAESPPDLILLDVIMPEMDGYEVCRRLKDKESTREIPVIFLTSMSDMENEVKGLEVGAADYVTKPINPPVLLARLNAQFQILLEKKKTDQLLRNVLPKAVAEELKEKGKTEPVNFKKAAVLFSDLVGFTRISAGMEARELIGELNSIFTEYDRVIESNQCERIKTIGDAYMAVSGMPIFFDEYADGIVKSAVEILSFLKNRRIGAKYPWAATIGIAAGEVVGGVVGTQKYIYDIFGSTVNLASRLQSAAKTYQIDLIISGQVFQDLKHSENFCLREIDTVRMKGIEEPVTLYEVFDVDSEELREKKKESLPAFSNGLKAYREGRFAEAQEFFKECEKISSEDTLPPVYIKRCSTLARLPLSPDWQGISGI